MLVCKSVSVWGHDLSTKQKFNRRAGWQSCIWYFGLMQIMERERTAYEYQEGSVWYYWYDASLKNICNQRQNHIMSMLRIHVGRNGGLTDHKIPRCCDATRMYTQKKVTKKVTDILVTSYLKK